MKAWSDFKIDVPTSGGAERFTQCPECSGTRKKKNAKCLSINVDKEIWLCHHCGWRGTLKTGEGARPKVDRFKPAVYTRPTFQLRTAAEPVENKLVAFFAARGISSDTIERVGVRLTDEWMPSLEERVLCIQFPYFRDGQVINVKSRTLVGKDFRQVADAEKILYGLDDIKGQDTAIIVEGEIDKLSFAQAGIYNVVSVPDGAPAENAKPSAKKFEYLENCQAYLDPLIKIILAVDSDGPGRALEQELMRRLGPERCWTVRWPDGVKDANDMLLAQGIDGLCTALEAAQPSPIEHVLTMQDLAEAVMMYYTAGRQRGSVTGFSNLDEFFTVAPGEFTVVTGIPSHGKSEFMDALMLNLIYAHSSVFAVCSPENKPTSLHIAKLTEKIVGKPFLPGSHERITPTEVVHAMTALNPHLYMIEAPDALSILEVIELAKALVLQKGITHMILDPWNEFDHTRPQGVTETDYISDAISRLKRFALRHQVHVFVVAHPTKLQRDKEGEYPIPTPYDIAGSAHWRNKPDNCITVWRNTQEDPHYSEIHIQKVRRKHIGRQGACALQWDPLCGRYTPTQYKRDA
jgi:twinkle protein